MDDEQSAGESTADDEDEGDDEAQGDNGDERGRFDKVVDVVVELADLV